MKDLFRLISGRISTIAGSAYAFALALSLIIIWGVSGPTFDYSNTWQLVINTTTTIVTFLMVFLIQNTQNRDSRAMQLKLDELIRTHKSARDSFVDLEDITDDELAELTNEFRKMHEQSKPTPAMHKLHQKLEQVHAKRQNPKL
jgi:low affinity Fe/Cu permease